MEHLPSLFWLWMISLNSLVGVGCAAWYLRLGMDGSLLVHIGADLVWHVLFTVGVS